MTHSDCIAQARPSELLPALIAAMAEARGAVAEQSLPRLEDAVRRQQELLAVIAEIDIRTLRREAQQLSADLSKEISVLARVMRRSNDTIRALLAVVSDRDPLYSLESLPRR